MEFGKWNTREVEYGDTIPIPSRAGIFLFSFCSSESTMAAMAHLARVVVPGLPHHVTQRGNRREAIFFEDGDQEIYRDLLAEQTKRRGVAVWAYCLMPNHVHLILTPSDELGLGLAVGEAHRRYTSFVNARGGAVRLSATCLRQAQFAQPHAWL
jgi:REP element-mobilizing transposase RayT